MKVDKSPRAEMLEGWDLYLLKLFPRICIQTCYSSIRHILESALTETISKEWLGGLQFPTVTERRKDRKKENKPSMVNVSFKVIQLF